MKSLTYLREYKELNLTKGTKPMNLPATLQNIQDLEASYKASTIASRDQGNKISESISMLQLSEVDGAIATAIATIEGMTRKGQGKSSFFAKIPLLGGMIQKAADNLDEQQIRSGKMVEVVNRLFTSLDDKQKNISSVMSTLYDLREKMLQEQEHLLEQDAAGTVLAQEDGMTGFKAKNVLVQVKHSLTKQHDRIQIIETTIQAAQASSLQICAMLPSLQGELVSEMAIQAGLQELKEYKQIFDTTVDLVADINQRNNESMKAVLLDVVDLAVNTKSDIARLEATANSREKFQQELKNKMQKAVATRDKQLEKLTEIRLIQGDDVSTNNLLGFTTSERDE